MRKIPTLFKRSERTHLVVPEIVPGCEWVGDHTVPQIATRKYDGICFKRDDLGVWWARREVKAGKEWPATFVLEEEDQVTHKTVGWIDATESSYAHQWADVLIKQNQDDPSFRWKEDVTYELCGPSVNGNPEGFEHDVLVEHGQHMMFDVPTDFEGLKAYLEYFRGEGVVWWAQDGRRAKIKRKDFWR
jgi:hypothetical protein